MGDKKKEYRDKRTGMQTVRSAIFAIVLIITGFISIIYVADNTYAADEYRVHKSEVVVKTGATYTVKILNHDTKVSPKKFKWTSSNSKCAKVINGRIYGLKPGQATITAQMSGLKVNCEVFVCNKTETVLFKKYKKQVKVTAGKTVILEPQKYGKRLTYTSSDKTVATVSKKGKVTAKKAGNVKITSVSYGTDRYVSEIEVIVLPAASETPEITPTYPPFLSEIPYCRTGMVRQYFTLFCNNYFFKICLYGKINFTCFRIICFFAVIRFLCIIFCYQTQFSIIQ